MGKVYVINNGGQYTHVIWRTVRDLGFDVEIIDNKVSYETVKGSADAVILSGGPGSAYKDKYELCEKIVKKAASGEFSKPILGICLGHQIIAHQLGGKVSKGENAEYGIMEIDVDDDSNIFAGVPKKFNAWVSHFDEVKKMPPEFVKLAHSKACEVEAMKHKKLQIYGVQFHPEVWHTENGEKILENFLKLIK
ncbi:GMP synthase [glutamine-hydrolyzing] subunit A [Candidatus Gugararchaeum adminiculabundum]|nr:GMP synthase [glutamine-hydrolyzing] subunit A [Candidatus Gugararchaeum adminiculabundum]